MGKRLIGGLFLLNLLAISLNLNAGEVDIENEEVLDQLKQLRSFIDEKRDFTKGFKDLKPVLVQYRSSASKIDGIVPCNLSFNTDALHLSIGGKSLQADGSVIDIVINVVFEFEEYVGYKIKSAKLYCSKNETDNVKFEVSNIKALNDEQLNSLKVGDIVVKVTGEQKHMYIVTYKQENHGICLSYFDASVVETQSYDYTDNHWVYNSEDKTEFSELGGLPEVTADDNGKVLEVIAGQWGKGGKKVNVIDAPSSTTLNDKQIEKIGGGVFNNGNFLGFKNPVLFPFNTSHDVPYQRIGTLIGTKINATATAITSYNININTNHISVDEDTYIEFGLAYGDINIKAYRNVTIKGRTKPQIEVALTNLGTITSTETSVDSNIYENEIPYSAGIGNEDVINIKMSDGCVYPCINDTTNSKLIVICGTDFASNNIEPTKCWKLGY